MKNKLEELNKLAGKPLAMDMNSFFNFLEYEEKEEIGKIGLIGSIDCYMADWFKNQLKVCKELNKAVIYIDSPGGEVPAALQIKDTILNFKKENPNISLIAYVHQMAASAAYWVASLTDKIYLNPVLVPTAAIGSIGIKFLSTDFSEMLKKQGIQYDAFVSGEGKLINDSAFALTEEQKKTHQNSVDKLANIFFADVSKARNLSLEAIKGLDGNVVDGNKALELGLIDGFKTLEEVMSTENIDTIDSDNPNFANSHDMSKEKELQDKIDAMSKELATYKEELAQLKKEKDEKDKAEASLTAKNADIEKQLETANSALEAVKASKKTEVKAAYQAFSGLTLEEAPDSYKAIDALDTIEDLDVMIAKYKKVANLTKVDTTGKPAATASDEDLSGAEAAKAISEAVFGNFEKGGNK